MLILNITKSMTKRFFFILSLIIGFASPVYSGSKLKFTYENIPILRIVSISGYEFPLVVYNEGKKDGVYRIEINNDSCIGILIEEANLLERDTTIKKGLDVEMQLILAKDGYGYDILNFCRYVDDSFGVELNGKPMRQSTKWSLFVKCLIDYHQKYKEITHQSLNEILRKCGMIK